MRGVINDYDLIVARMKLLNEGKFIENSQLPLDIYLDRLTSQERTGLQQILKGLSRISSQYFRTDSYLYGLLAVGTITYDETYWQELEPYLKEEAKLEHILQNKGEDIDLVFCPEHCNLRLLKFFEKDYALRFNKQTEPTQEEIFNHRKQIRNTKDFKTRTLSEDEEFVWAGCYDLRTMLTGVAIENEWKHSPWLYGTAFGANYFSVPKYLIEKTGQKMIRTKGEDWGVENMTIRMSDCRPFHIYVNDSRCFLHKISYERIINIPFTVLCSAGTYNDLQEQIDKKNGAYIASKSKGLSNREGCASKQHESTDEFPF